MTQDITFFAGLYSGHSCYADRLTPEQLESIHVHTPLEESMRKWLLKGRDLVLVGNPGDGKTHLLRRIEQTLRKIKAEVILDATAEPDYPTIIQRWKAAQRKKRPFCLAINQGPLYRLLALSDAPFDRLCELQEQCKHLLTYDEIPVTPKQVIVVDLNLRSVLNRPIIETALDNLLRDDVFAECASYFADDTTDGGMNRQALRHPQVRSRLVRLLEAAGHTGHHVTMRDLQGFLSYLLFGGRTGPALQAATSSFRWRYFNLCFEGQGELFEAVRTVFDPVRATVPAIDEDLWENTGVHTGWIFSRPPLTPDHYDDAWDQFVWLKRQYYFEHAEGERLLGAVAVAVADDDAEFLRMLQSGGNVGSNLPRLLRAINRFFCPADDDEGEFLRLWVSQQYDCHPAHVAVSCFRISGDRFSLTLPKLAPWLAPAMEYQPDHLLLRYRHTGGSTASLRMDQGFWRALMLAGQGVPANLRSPQYAQALTTFLRKLHRYEAIPRDREQFVLYNHANHQRLQVIVDRQRRIYVPRP